MLWTSFGGNDKIKLLSLSPADTSVTAIYNSHFKGKVLYVDFWGTTCGPCLEEFRTFTKPLKQTLNNRSDIAYLYICGGRKLIWKQQLQKLEVEGSHIFLNEKDYAHFYRQAIKGDKDTTVMMPRYLIIDKDGKIANTNAPRPSEKDSLINQLNKYRLLTKLNRIMNNTFNLKRFLLLFKKQTAEHLKAYLLSTAVLFGTVLLLFAYVTFTENGRLTANTQTGIFVWILILSGSIFTSLCFSSLGSKQGILTLTLPASHLEKFPVQWVYSFVIFQIVFIGVFFWPIASFLVCFLQEPTMMELLYTIELSVF
ncbi:TlpA family protein disulfide reductase [Mucilaginibacter humi]|uniref:TlpA family protein disulfide reductase n=1 Tax=Mucilaginibacter humi TaxID=2732510 RepID=UPI00293BA2BF|nr:redoxin family protein [Mucilaginibacter humi]